MSDFYFFNGMKAGQAKVRASFQKAHETGRYLISVWFGIEHGRTAGGTIEGTMPQTWAVVDDFGNLVVVEGFR